MKKGKFIVFDAVDGAGKSTQIQLMKQYIINQLGKEVVMTREPGGTPIAEALRDIVKSVEYNEVITLETELALMYASRSQLVENRIKPALQKGKWVLGDRHDLSSHAYQGYGRQVPLQKIEMMKSLMMGDFEPDLNIILDIDPASGLERARGRGAMDRIEESGLGFFNRARNGYLELAKKSPHNCRVVNADQPIEKVAEDVLIAFNDWHSNPVIEYSNSL